MILKRWTFLFMGNLGSLKKLCNFLMAVKPAHIHVNLGSSLLLSRLAIYSDGLIDKSIGFQLNSCYNLYNRHEKLILSAAFFILFPTLPSPKHLFEILKLLPLLLPSFSRCPHITHTPKTKFGYERTVAILSE